MEKEIWKPVPDYEGLYEVSNHGRVKRLEYYRKHWKSGLLFYKERILKQTTLCGYVNYKLYKNKSKKIFKGHRLVAILFIPNPNRLKEVNHIDGDKTNNYYKNLEWVNHRENVTHRYSGESSSSNFVGVHYRPDLNKKYVASIMIKSKSKYIGCYDTPEEAHQAYLDALKTYGLKNKYAKKPPN